MKEATRDAAGVTIYVGDTVGGTTSKLSTIVGELIQIGTSKVKVRLDQDAIPIGRGPVAGDERWVSTERAFLVRRAVKTRQVLFTGDVDTTLNPSDRRQAAWLLVRAVGGCDCTDPEPVTCTAGCLPASQGPQCSCHHIPTVGEVRSLINRVRAMNPITDGLDELHHSLTESYVESGCRDADAQRYAREFLAHHARALAAIMHMAGPYLADDAGRPFTDGFAGGADYLRAYAYGLDPEGNGGK